jgi:hypothetical protein
MKNIILTITFACLCSIAFGQLFTANTLQFGGYTGNFGMGTNPKSDSKLFVKGNSSWSTTAAILAEATSSSIYAKAIEGQSPNGIGVFGKSDAGYGLYAFSQSGVALKAHSQAGNAAIFDGSVSIRNGHLQLDDFRADMANGNLDFQRFDNGSYTSGLLLQGNGKVGVGDVDMSASGFKLFVEEGIATGRVKIDQAWADYVFDEDYDMESLEEVDAFIQENGHLPRIPSQATIEADGGFEVGEMTVRQQEKIEELFLHLIEMQSRIKNLEAALTHTMKENTELKDQLQSTTSSTDEN